MAIAGRSRGTATTDPLSTVTLSFLFTDLEGSTRLWEQHPDVMRDALLRHDTILRRAVESSGGEVVKTTGDGLMAVFRSAPDAVAASLTGQFGMGRETWADTGPLRVRMAVHTGPADLRGGDYFGTTVNRTARLMAAGHGGQVLLSSTTAALAQAQLPGGTTLVDLGEHRLKDLDRPEHVYQLSHPDLAPGFPPLATVRQATADLPARVAELIGRDDEVRRIKELLADPGLRLLTLTGPGGTGKTTLAVRVAEDVETTFANGAAFVDLSSARDTTAVLTAIARAIGLDDVVERPQVDEIAQRLRAREMLLVLDNLEQVTESAGAIAQLLSQCPTLKVLATSREPLHVRAERVLPIQPLAVPPVAHGRRTASEASLYAAVRLFVDRALTVRPDFELTDDNAAAVAEICRRLDGLPLAIELAAVRIRLFPPEELEQRLGDRLGLLRSGPRDLPERQQTLRATMDWSYDLLEPRDQYLFELLGAFADADISAIEAVAELIGAIDGQTIDALDGLAGLVDKSLVRQVDNPGGEPRIAMLETMREFARDRLARRPDLANRAREAHATYYMAIVDRVRAELTGMSRRAALDTLAAESANLRLCWSYWVAAGDFAQLNRLVGPLMTLDDDRGWYLNTVDLAEDMLTVLEASDPSDERISQEIALRTSLARALMITRGVTPEVEEAYARAVELFERGGDRRQHHSVLKGLSSLYMLRGQPDQASRLGQEMIELGERDGEPQMLVDGHLLAGAFHVTSADPTIGLEHLETAIALAERSLESGTPWAVAGSDSRVSCYTTTALTLQLMGMPDSATRRADQALALADRTEHPFTLGYGRFHAGLQRLFQRDAEQTAALAGSLLELAEEHGFRIWIAAGSVLRGSALVSLGRAEEGLEHVRAGMALYQILRSPPIFWPFLLYIDATASLEAGHAADGLPKVDSAIDLLANPPPGATMLPELFVLKGDLLAALAGDGNVPTTSIDLYQRAIARATEIGFRSAGLRAATRLARADASPNATAQLAAVYETFTEGFGTADLREARTLLEQRGAT